ncbi:hypothetical protein B9Z19DRAFT_1128786 [Tuber borchii]|uniref:Uncharacterized protein n=1 Tax=Tuber borchii TaxID=42251 RepID=A0A2T6ZNN1_TUBBO|nr:hypothetical protein B9Z19DRAFT_1128786 [Tuber borchii]
MRQSRKEEEACQRERTLLVLEQGECAQATIGFQLDPALLDQLSIGMKHDRVIRELLDDEWLAWDLSTGHIYYNRRPWKPRNLRGISRLDMNTLIRLRSGISVVGHDDCPLAAERHHLFKCMGYNQYMPGRNSLLDHPGLPKLMKWWQSHFNFGLGSPPSHKAVDGENGTLAIRGFLECCHWWLDEKCPGGCEGQCVRLPHTKYLIPAGSLICPPALTDRLPSMQILNRTKYSIELVQTTLLSSPEGMHCAFILLSVVERLDDDCVCIYNKAFTSRVHLRHHLKRRAGIACFDDMVRWLNEWFVAELADRCNPEAPGPSTPGGPGDDGWNSSTPTGTPAPAIRPIRRLRRDTASTTGADSVDGDDPRRFFRENTPEMNESE